MIAEFSIVPIGQGEELSGPVAEVLDIVDRSGLGPHPGQGRSRRESPRAGTEQVTRRS